MFWYWIIGGIRVHNTHADNVFDIPSSPSEVSFDTLWLPILYHGQCFTFAAGERKRVSNLYTKRYFIQGVILNGCRISVYFEYRPFVTVYLWKILIETFWSMFVRFKSICQTFLSIWLFWMFFWFNTCYILCTYTLLKIIKGWILKK